MNLFSHITSLPTPTQYPVMMMLSGISRRWERNLTLVTLSCECPQGEIVHEHTGAQSSLMKIPGNLHTYLARGSCHIHKCGWLNVTNMVVLF